MRCCTENGGRFLEIDSCVLHDWFEVSRSMSCIMYYVLCIMENVATGVWGCALMEMAMVDCVLINW